MEEKDKIVEYVRKYGPVSIVEIAQALGLDVNPLRRDLVKLREEKVIEKTGGTKRAFYIVPEGITYGEIPNIKSTIAKETARAKDSCFDLEEKVNQMGKSIKGFYANMISLMAIFVAIFALITVNVNVMTEFIKDSMWEGVAAIAVINVMAILCIIALLAFTRIMLVNPLIKDTNKKIDE